MSIRATKLTFKGDKPSKKRKRKERDDDGPSSSRLSPSADDEPERWVLPENALELRGPTFIFHPSEPPLCVSYDTGRSKLALSALSPAADQPLKECTPAQVSHVWVATRVAGAETVNFRTGISTSSGAPKFLGCDAHGLVSADREARGPQEEWTPVLLPDAGGMVAFQNSYGKYLSVDETAGGSMALRGDSDTIGFAEQFWAKVQ
ncbi:hypothetical protein AURDEDRAFT_28969, partial [Auricularia subglabra TFB-10046 SS5]